MPATIETQDGLVQGMRVEGLHHFRGIPYAQPPVGPLRFRAPQPVVSWRGVLDATAYGSVCPQELMPHNEALPGPPIDLGGEMDEDCLYLNVLTPDADDAKRPVLVSIHGGNFTMGSGADSFGGNSRRLVERGDVVHVTFNYRLGALGFLHLADAVGSELDTDSNPGLHDQVAALRWIRDNIGAFGGDPDNVTIYGISAGGMSVGALLGTPAAQGLFRRAAAQSGACHNVHTREVGDRVARGFLAELGLLPSEASKLREIPALELVAAQERYYNLMQTMTMMQEYSLVEHPSPAYAIAYQPSVDGHLLPELPIDAIVAGLAKDVSVLVGNTADEQKMGAMFDPSSPKTEVALRAAIAQRVRTVGADGRDDADVLLERYRAEYPDAPADALFGIWDTDRIFQVPAVRLAEAQSRHQSQTYSYLFNWQSPIPGVGAAHGMDGQFIYDRLDQPGMDMFVGSGPEARTLVDQVQNAWIAFARTGNPSHAGIGAWPTYREDERATMLLGRDCVATVDPAHHARTSWEGLL